jgi:hypothetical protein
MKKSIKAGSPEGEFVGELENIAEDKFKANLHGESQGEVWEDALFAEYKAAGSPKPAKKWIAERIKNEFKSMDKPPKWVDFETSIWPFHKGKPMVFLAQFPLKATKDTEALIDGEGVAYIFGISDKGEHGEDIMVYRGQTLTKW